jgi:hypothetical protein
MGAEAVTSDWAMLAFVATVAVVLAAYLSPTITAGVRRVPNVGSVLAINLLLGWSLVGWALAWAMALRTRPPRRPALPAAVGPGWYPDPLRPGRLRYWSGGAWSDAVHDSSSPPA